MPTLGDDFEDNLREAVLDEVERVVRDEIGPQLIEVAEENWKSYASEHGYEIDHIWEDAEGPIVEREDDRVTLRIEWPELTALFEYGVDPHTIEGNPLLSFVWEGPPGGTRPAGAPKYISAQEVNWGSVTGGIEESRAIRDAMTWIRRELR